MRGDKLTVKEKEEKMRSTMRLLGQIPGTHKKRSHSNLIGSDKIRRNNASSLGNKMMMSGNKALPLKHVTSVQ